MGLSQLFESLITPGGSLAAVRAVLAFVLVFFLPGFAWTFVLFHGINVMERIVLSFGLSIAAVALSIIALNLVFGVRITGTNSLITIMGITAVALIIYTLKRFLIPKKSSDGD